MSSDAPHIESRPNAEFSREAVRDERWHWRFAFVAPLLVGVPWAVLMRSLGWPEAISSVGFATLAMLLAWTVVSDVSTYRIPNYATMPAIAWALLLIVIAAVVGDPPWSTDSGSPSKRFLLAVDSWQDALGGFCFALILLIGIVAVSGGGGGDVKVAAAIGGFMGVYPCLMAFFYACVVALAFGLVYLVWTVRSFPRGVGLFSRLKIGIPLAPFFAIGVGLEFALR